MRFGLKIGRNEFISSILTYFVALLITVAVLSSIDLNVNTKLINN